MKLSPKAIASYVYYRLLMNHNTRIDVEKIHHYAFSSTELYCISISTNNIIETPLGYFRLIRRNLSQKRFDKETKEIFSIFNPIDTNGNDDLEKRKENFVRFKKHEDNLRSHSCRLFKYNCFNANSAIAETIVAKYLGLQDLLTSTELCKLTIDNKHTVLGTMSSKARGVKYEKVKNGLSQRMTPKLLQTLTNYNLLDVICYEQDHGANNYMNLIDEEGKIYSICSFDNDSPTSFKLSTSVNFTFSAEGRPFVSSDGFVTRPWLDKEVVERLESIDLSALKKDLSQYLNCVQLYCCVRRIEKLNKAIQKSVANGVVKLLEPIEWTQQMVEEEIAGNNGRTYMYVLVDWHDFFNKPRKKTLS